MEFTIKDNKLIGIQNPDQDVHIPEGVKSLGADVFNSLKEVRNVWFPSSLVDCHGCRVLLFRDQENIFVHKDNPVFASHEGVLYNKNLTRLLCCPMKKQGTYKLAPTTRTISADAFCCSSLDEIILNEGLETIERTVFVGRSHKKWIFIPESVSQIDAMAFDGEWTCQGILVKKDSYAHQWARRYHERLYKCIDFDEEADKQRRLKEASCIMVESANGKSVFSVDNPPCVKEDLIIGRDWVFVRTDGRIRFVCGNAREDFILEVCNWENVVYAVAGFHEVFAVLSGDVIVWASNRKDETKPWWDRFCSRCEQFDVMGMLTRGKYNWRGTALCQSGFSSIVACEGRVAVVTRGGNIKSMSDQSGYERPEDYDAELERQFSTGGAKKLAVGWLHAAVLDASGKVHVIGEKEYCNAGGVLDWRDIVDVDVFGCYYSPIQTVGLRADGKVLHTLACDEIDLWRGIVSVSCLGDRAVVALNGDGHIMLAGDDGRLKSHRETVKEWPPMIAIKGNYGTLVGVDKDGRIWVSGVESHNQ